MGNMIISHPRNTITSSLQAESAFFDLVNLDYTAWLTQSLDMNLVEGLTENFSPKYYDHVLTLTRAQTGKHARRVEVHYSEQCNKVF